jgi:hypothetical protein
MTRELRQAVQRRDATLARLRWTGRAAAVAGLTLTAGFGSLAAASTHTRKAVTHVTIRARRRLPPVTAPAPPLVTARAPAPQPPPAPTPAPVAVAPTYAPVVVSGGS